MCCLTKLVCNSVAHLAAKYKGEWPQWVESSYCPLSVLKFRSWPLAAIRGVEILARRTSAFKWKAAIDPDTDPGQSPTFIRSNFLYSFIIVCRILSLAALVGAQPLLSLLFSVGRNQSGHCHQTTLKSNGYKFSTWRFFRYASDSCVMSAGKYLPRSADLSCQEIAYYPSITR